MGKTEKRPLSLKSRLLWAAVVCWVLPIFTLVLLSGLLLSHNYQRSSHQELESAASAAMDQIQLRVLSAVEACKAVSYDGVVRSAYRSYSQDGDSAALYSTVSEYLNQSFSRDEAIGAVFISFSELPGVKPYVSSQGTSSANTMLRSYWQDVEPKILEEMAQVETGIYLFVHEGRLYLARNLLDSRFDPYATVVMGCRGGQIFQGLSSVAAIGRCQLTIDSLLEVDSQGQVSTLEGELMEGAVSRSFTAAGHDFSLQASPRSFTLWAEIPELKLAVALAVLLCLPMLILMIWEFRKLVSRPVAALIQASNSVSRGQRGYQIRERAESAEFQEIFEHFNSMSLELEDQFQRSYKEQQALQQARIKALQSQINPHFLNNTLEIINWEARLAQDERVCAMIEALSTMLDAALGRDGRGWISLKEELSYVDAYLYIISQRLGSGLKVDREIAGDMLEAQIPRLILQPLVENAVEHDISLRRGGHIVLRAYGKEGRTVLEVEHDGQMSVQDREAIDRLLQGDYGEKAQVGLKNVTERLKLLYGGEGRIEISQLSPQRILARISFPMAGSCSDRRSAKEKQ